MYIYIYLYAPESEGFDPLQVDRTNKITKGEPCTDGIVGEAGNGG